MAKLIVDVPDQTLARLQELASRQGIELGELLRQAVGLYGFALNSAAGGKNKLSLLGPDNEVLANIAIGTTSPEGGSRG